MFKKVMRRYLSLIIVLAMILSLLPGGLTITAYAATNLDGLTVDDLSVTYSAGGWIGSGNMITGSVTGEDGTCSSSATTATLVLTNNKNVTAKLMFNYTVTLNSGSLTVGGTSVTEDGTYSYSGDIEDDGTLQIVLTSGTGSSYTSSLSITDIYLLVEQNVTTTFVEAENGSYAVNGTEITQSTSITQTSTTAYSLVATPADGYQFLGWYSTTDKKYLSTSASTSLYLSSDQTVTAVFGAEDAAVFETGGGRFTDLNEAVTYAQKLSASRITLVADGVLPAGNYTIPAGITLLIPFDEAGTCYTTEPAYSYNTSWTSPVAYRTLTMESGASITVNGSLSISAKVNAAGSGSGNANKSGGSTIGSYGYVYMEDGSSITIGNDGGLYCWGYLSGDGEVTAKSGAVVYEPFQLADFRGGTATLSMANNSKIFPLSQWYLQNIEAKLTIEAGASEYGFTALYAMSMTVGSSVALVGSSGMFQLEEGSSLVKSYDPSTDRMSFEIYGNTKFSSISLTIMSQEINSANYKLPLNTNIDLIIHSGTTTVSQDIDVLPGVEMTVDAGATLAISSGYSVYLYDLDDWDMSYFYGSAIRPTVYSPTRTCTRTNSDLKDAVLDVNGTVNVGGDLYTTTSGAAIKSSEGTGQVVMTNGAGTATSTQQATQSGSDVSYVDISITSAQLLNGDGTYTVTEGATSDTTYTYNKSVEKWVTACTKHTEGEAVVENEVVATCTESGSYDSVVYCSVCGEEISRETITVSATGHSYEAVVTAPTCTEQGYTTYTCTVCGDSYVGDYTVATGHTWDEGEVTTDATCTDEGVMTHTCTVCGETKTEAISATGHMAVIDAAVAATCTETGLTEGSHCSVCGAVIVAQEVIPALNHDYEAVVTAPTCTEQGFTTYTCSRCGDSYISDYTDALGHTYVAVVTDPTCTEQGYTTYTCSVCGDSYVSSYVDALGHSYDEGVVTQVATCTEDGMMTYTCTVCGETKTDTITATGHTYVGEVTTAATCTEDGVMTYTCSVCGDSYTEVIPVTGHTVVVDEAVAATCTENGLTEGSHCSACGEVLVAQEVIPATSHSYEVSVTTPSDTVQCVATYTCATCGDSYTEYITGLYEIGDDTYYLNENSYAVSGLVRIVKDDGEVNYYYFRAEGDDEVNTDKNFSGATYTAVKNVPESGSDYWITKTNDLLPEWGYYFDENGVILHDEDTSKNGIVNEDGTLYYYIDGIRAPAGMIKIDDDYYYANSKGQLIVGQTYYCSRTNGLMDEGTYAFDEEGKLIVGATSKNGIVAENDSLYYYVDGVITYAGLIQVDGDYYYVRSNGEVVHDCTYYITWTHGLMDAGYYTFDETGKLTGTPKNGIVTENDSLYYYVNGELTYAGLIEIDGSYYYVKSNCEVVHDCTYYVTWTHGLMDAGYYTFDETGKLTGTPKNGIVAENDSLYYYVNGELTYAGLIEIDGSYYYVRSTCEVVHGCTYYITWTHDLMDAGSYTFDDNGKMIIE